MHGTGTLAPPPQHLRALARANQVRLARAELKRRIGAGRLTAGEVIRTCPPEAEGMAVAELLTSQRRWGHNRVRRVLAEVMVSETKTLGSMTERQRRALDELLARA
ncbi:MAG: hypothetical protein M3P39_06375 [Actinomycetota bacterium]|jgi:hypothetical protein|nr:hypothetical protein [Actinomycetota bacterium]